MSQEKNKLLNFLSEPITVKKDASQWRKWQLIVFRFLFIFFLYFIIPIDPSIYQKIIDLPWSENPFYGLFVLFRYQPEFIPLVDSEGVPVLGLASYSNWLIGFAIAIIGAFIWTIRDSDRKEYNTLYYWLRVLVRYRLALLLFAYGIYKLFLLQIPSASLSNLFTHYGDAYAWKVYYQTTSLSNFYVSFLGGVEILGALLLLFRRTEIWGAGLILGYIGNVAVANSFYDLGDLSLSTFVVFSAAFVFSSQVIRLQQLLLKEQRVDTNSLIVDYDNVSWLKWRKITRIALFLILFLLTWSGFAESLKGFGSYKYPQTAGLSDAYGVYDVKEFIINNDTIPYSNIDSTRWQNVIFEKWSTLSIRSHKPVSIDKSSGEEYQALDIDRNYELAGFVGRHYYHYTIDSAANTLQLINKNKHHRDEVLKLSYERPNDKTIILNGKDSDGQEIKVLLEKVDKSYMLLEGRRKAARL